MRFLDETTGERRESVPEWAFAYTLGGRAVQDVLIARDADDQSLLDGCASTIRVYDSNLGA